jgi:hypothetical protein
MMTSYARSMTVTLMAAASGVALTFFLSPAFAQTQDSPERGRVNAQGMPTTHSTPAEKAETAQINREVGAANAAVDAQAGANNAQFQAQQQQYQGQLQNNQAQQAAYADNNARYNALRTRYAIERAAYHRGEWPGRYRTWVVAATDTNLIGGRVQLISGSRVGTVTDTAHGANGDVTALLVKLDNDKVVWIDSGDVRYNRADGVVMTNLNRADLRHMADQRL